MKIIEYLAKNGIKHSLEIIYQYKIDLLMQRALKPFLRNKPLKNIIIIESHNDFDSNGGAFYNYLIKNDYNKKYKIVWLIKNWNTVPELLPENVECVPLFRPSFKKNVYFWQAKFFSYDCECRGKLRADQKAYYLSHGAVSLKNTKGYLNLPESIDFCLTSSEYMAPIHADIFALGFPNTKQIIVGYPAHDVLYTPSENEIKKLTTREYDNYILWMPTFRKLNHSNRIDSVKDSPLGIPIIRSVEDLNKIEEILKKNNTLLIIKIHPMQQPSEIRIRESEYIKILDGKSVKKLDIDNYKLMKDCHALISDYSSAGFDFLHLNRPIAYTMDDAAEYKLGFIVEDPTTMMAGDIIKDVSDFACFIESIAKKNDIYKERREDVLKKVFKYHDGNSAKRLVEHMNL